MPIMARAICRRLPSDEAEFAINADVVPVAKLRSRNINQTGIFLTLFGLAGLGKLDRPAGIGVLLRRTDRMVGPDIGRTLAGLDPRLLVPGVALTRG